jgi:pyruvate dehydrogenase E2 component (dihydrolipoamide acetyltransferase)
MEKPFTMPKLGATMTEGTILRWLYQPGDRIVKGEPVVEIMTDKVNIEVEAPLSGRLARVLARDGDVLPVGSPLAFLVDDSDVHVITENVQIPPSTPAAKREAALLGIDLHAVVQAGARLPLNRDDILAFVERTRYANQQQENGRPSFPAVPATPLAQKIAREHEVDLALVAERKPGGKVKRADVEAHLHQVTGAEQAAEIVEAPSPGPSPIESPDEVLNPLSPARQLIGKRMQQSISVAPHIYLDLEIDMMEAERCRQSLGRNLQDREETAPSMTALIVRAVAAAILLHPDVNAVFEQGALQGQDAIRQRRSVHVGIATDTERALMTPVIRSAHQLSLQAIARELRRLTQAARQGTLTPDEVKGATFTISNLGMYGIDTFHAIIVPGQSAILAVGKVTRRSIVIGDDETARLEIRPVMKVSLSADHRVLDGASGSRFLQQLKLFLENPYLLL